MTSRAPQPRVKVNLVVTQSLNEGVDARDNVFSCPRKQHVVKMKGFDALREILGENLGTDVDCQRRKRRKKRRK
ncbi:hypothetical protein CEXT_773331 [Caerostris extrusa]|uniref:Uncharacterized protein n=1 Tax=Caerostris extrusa TaxID=172846 RepID=A0AAV4MUG8_CAEEX|nr:hypothetical protein CEXT_773331 [Caerostris extrusa]